MSEVYLVRTTYDELARPKNKLNCFFKHLEGEQGPRKGDLVGLKLSFGEKGNTSHINPRSLGGLVKFLLRRGTKPFLFDTNTLYRGKRLNSVDHLNLAQQHGFGKLNIPLMIGDGLKGHDDLVVPAESPHFSSAYLASVLKDTDYCIVLSHFTMHMLTGFGAALKNLGMGCASRKGKMQQHCLVSPEIDEKRCVSCGACAANCPADCIRKQDNGKYLIDGQACLGCAQCISVCPAGAVEIQWSEESGILQEKMLCYARAVTRQVRCAFFNFCVFITRECDCMNEEKEGFVPDVGVVFGFDPVAVDKASCDLVIAASGRDSVKEVHPKIGYRHQFSYAQEIGFGSPEYRLIEVS
jgi:uncharacterized Fe-S center protein